MRIALAQMNPIVGDIAGNTARAGDFIERAKALAADLVVFGELSVAGYPPRDLLRKSQFVAENADAVDALARRCEGIAALVGFVRATPEAEGRPLQNCAALLADGEVRQVHVKALLPTYDVFDETRYFEPADRPECIEFGGLTLGLSICEDLWDPQALGRQLYDQDPVATLRQRGAKLIVNMAASPFESGKAVRREEMFVRQASRSGAAVLYVNQVGGNDELVFDGTSCVVDASGKLIGRALSFEEDLLIVDVHDGGQVACESLEPLQDEITRVAGALKLGLRDYVHKCGFTSVVLGLSGGIDSAVVATLAADALGPDNVHALAMPSRYSSDHSLADAMALAHNLGVNYQVLGIEAMHEAFEQSLGQTLAGGRVDVAEENIQARIRGCIVMAMSNAYGYLPLATGNKSELSCGYCTLYGDMVGGLAPIGDLLKVTVYELARHLSDEGEGNRIPESTLTKPPSAELKPEQTDQDKLPPYDVLDGILARYVEQDRTSEQIIDDGFDPAVVRRVVQMVDSAEYKRKQAAPVLKVSSRAFGTGRRMPIAQRYVSGKEF